MKDAFNNNIKVNEMYALVKNNQAFIGTAHKVNRTRIMLRLVSMGVSVNNNMEKNYYSSTPETKTTTSTNLVPVSTLNYSPIFGYDLDLLLSKTFSKSQVSSTLIPLENIYQIIVKSTDLAKITEVLEELNYTQYILTTENTEQNGHTVSYVRIKIMVPMF